MSAAQSSGVQDIGATGLSEPKFFRATRRKWKKVKGALSGQPPKPLLEKNRGGAVTGKVKRKQSDNSTAYEENRQTRKSKGAVKETKSFKGLKMAVAHEDPDNKNLLKETVY